MNPLQVKHSRGHYNVHWLNLKELSEILPKDALWIIDQNVFNHWGHLCKNPLVLPPGEASKSFDTYRVGLKWLTEQKARRNTPLIAFGGGATLDLVGFLAATYMRGIPYESIPTTLIAQVDAAIGGKVGINLEEGKNLVGTFYPPRNVYIVREFLGTLSSREYTSGISEIIKYALIGNPPFFEHLTTHPLTRTSNDLSEIIHSCVKQKIKIVEEDEHDLEGIRAQLNFGHTIGHALEKVTGYGALPHGEAVSIGMVYEAKLAETLGISTQPLSEKIIKALNTQNLPTQLPDDIDPNQLVQAMGIDKKNKDSNLSFSLLKDMGHCLLFNNVSDMHVLQTLKESDRQALKEY